MNLTYTVNLNLFGTHPLENAKPFNRDAITHVREHCRKRHSFESGCRMVEIARDGVVFARAYCISDRTIGHAYYESLVNLRRAVGIERFECAQRYRRSRDYPTARHMLGSARELMQPLCLP